MQPFLSRIKGYGASAYAWARAHKAWAGVIIIAVIAGGYYAYVHYKSTHTTAQYVLAAAARGTLTVSVTGSGQVAANQSLDLAPKASGEVTYVGVKAGDRVAAGAVIARVDDTDAEKSLRDAATSLTSAKISYQQSMASYANDTSKSVDTALSTSAAALADLSTVLPDVDSALNDRSTIPGHTDQLNRDAYTSILGNDSGNVSDNAEAAYRLALAAYQAAAQKATTVTRNSSNEDVSGLIASVEEAASAAAEATTETREVMTLANDKLVRGNDTLSSEFTALLSTIGADATKMGTDASSALSAQTDLNDALATLGDTGTTPLAVQSAQISLQKAQNAYQDALDNLSDYVVTAPFSGTIAKVNVQVHDQSSGAVATLVTDEQYAQLSLNEVDAEKVRDGQKAMLTFDAIDGLSLEGTVAEVDSVGTVSQGVVTYDVKISFDTQDARVKPGMTVNATIVTDSKDDALIVPSSAVTTTGGKSFVQVVTEGAPAPSAPQARMASSTDPSASSTREFRAGSASTTAPSARFGASGSFARGTGTETVDAAAVTVSRVPVTVGLSNDTETEIVSGLTEGEYVVERSITAAQAGTAASAAGARTTTARPAGFGGGGAVFRAGG